eukprot:342500-Alexandrium_andersonii.AAC.1
MLGSSVPKDPRSAPSGTDYQSIISDRSKRAPFHAAAKGGCAGIEKRTQVLWALAERRRNFERNFLRTAVCVPWYQDTRQARLVVRYCAVTADLQEIR